jgi:Tfp pilus assembly major pilin PilA
MQFYPEFRGAQRGLSLVGFLFVLAIVAMLAVLGLKVVPTVVEYTAIKKALANAASTGNSAAEIKASFDRQRDTAYIDSVTGKDLEITKNGEGRFIVGVAYEKKIPLFGPASLVIDYEANAGGK